VAELFAKLVPSAPDDFERIGPKWRKECPASVVLFATDGRGAVCIIDHQGPDAAYIMEDSLIRKSFVDDDLAPWAFPGLWIWEGRVRGHRDYWGEYDETNEGEVRPLTEDEHRAIREDDLVWDPTLWIEPEPEKVKP
jgi:hypothetical protein